MLQKIYKNIIILKGQSLKKNCRLITAKWIKLSYELCDFFHVTRGFRIIDISFTSPVLLFAYRVLVIII